MQTTHHQIRRKIAPTLRRAGVKRASLFGSFVQGTATQKSDVDLLVELPKDASLMDLVRLKQRLEKDLDREVDVLTYDGIYHRLREQVLREQVPIYPAAEHA